MAKTFTKLTRPDMRKLKAGQKLTEHGICFERLPNGDGVFTVNIMVDGQRIHRVVGRETDGTTRTQAEDFIDKVRQDAKHDRLDLPRGRKVAMTFDEAATKYLDRLEETDGKDIKSKTHRLKHHLVPFFGKMKLSKITQLDIERYRKQRSGETVIRRPRGKEVAPAKTDKKVEPATINRELAVLSHMFTRATQWGWISHKPTEITREKESEGRIVYLTEDQVIRVLDCARKDADPQIYPFVAIGLGTSLRLSEILRIQKADIDFERQVIFIPKAKRTARREQPITRGLADYLREYTKGLGGLPWLFPSPSSATGHTIDIRKRYRRVIIAAGLDPDVILRHTLRHTAITHLVQAGVDLPTVKRISGHKTLRMVERYAHQNGAHIEAAMDKLEGRIKIS